MASEPGESLGGVSDTALGAAEMRAEESARPDRLFDDPYASAFVAAAPPLFPDIPSISDNAELAALIESSIAEIAIRTRFYDDYLAAACASGCHQVVLLAAGLDTRAFRLSWPTGVRLFELDLPEVFAFKERVLGQQRAEPKCTRTAVAVDLREDWPARLTAAGFAANAATAWLAEGLLPYLSNDDALRLLTAVGELSTGGSRLSFENDDSTLDQARAMPGMQEVASMWQGGLIEDPAAWLTGHGWQVRTHPRASLAATYGRQLSQSATGGFLTAQRSHNTPVG